jgi:hypothetical protein
MQLSAEDCDGPGIIGLSCPFLGDIIIAGWTDWSIVLLNSQSNDEDVGKTGQFLLYFCLQNSRVMIKELDQGMKKY